MLGAGAGVVNISTGVVSGMSGNITRPDGSRVTIQDIINGDFKVNNNFYLSGKASAGINTTRTESTSHTESSIVSTIQGNDKNSSITFNNQENVVFEGTQAKDTTLIYNNVENVRKEAVELNNSYSSRTTSAGIGVSAALGADMKAKNKGITLDISASGSKQEVDETFYQNGKFENVNEVHNNTGTMVLDGFNQEGGVVTGTIDNLEVVSKQNTSETDGYSYGVNVGIGLAGSPSSLDLSGSITDGNRAFVDNQSSFVIGQGSNLEVGNATNVAGIIGTEDNAKMTIENYEGRNLENEDELTTVGASVGLGGEMKNRTTSLSGVGVSLDTRDKEGITRNTVIGNVEIGASSGDEINRDLAKVNEVTKDKANNTNVYLESETINYLVNPEQFKEDLAKAKYEVDNKLKTVNEFIDTMKSKLGLKEEDKLEIIYVNAPLIKNDKDDVIKNLNDENKQNLVTEEFLKKLEIPEHLAKTISEMKDITKEDVLNLPSAEGQGLDFIKSADEKEGIPYAKDNAGNIIYAKDMSKVDYSKDKVDGKNYKLYLYENNKFILYETKDKTLYLTAEALQIDVLNEMNKISSNPEYDKEMGTTIYPVTLYKNNKKNSETMTIYKAKEAKTSAATSANIPYTDKDVQMAHTHPADISITGNRHNILTTEFFSQGDVEAVIGTGKPLSLATAGLSSHNIPPKIFILYPTGEVHYLGRAETYKNTSNSPNFTIKTETVDKINEETKEITKEVLKKLR